VLGEISRFSGSIKLSLALDGAGWAARVNGDKVANLAAALGEFALVCFEPGSHSLISGGSAVRRRFFDWILFHVEHGYLAAVRDFRRILSQRNALLKKGSSNAELDIWDREFVRASIPLAELREKVFRNYAIELAKILSIFLPELGAPDISLRRGWPNEDELADVVARSREQDRFRGHTTRGPHRADWSIKFENAPSRDQLSRGQEKLCALACVLAQAQVYAAAKGEWPVIALDDFASELDAKHQAIALEMLSSTPAQILISGIEIPSSLQAGSALRVFHVEHGTLKGLI
jgi:DNA replication and repair protein RecF